MDFLLVFLLFNFLLVFLLFSKYKYKGKGKTGIVPFQWLTNGGQPLVNGSRDSLCNYINCLGFSAII